MFGESELSAVVGGIHCVGTEPELLECSHRILETISVVAWHQSPSLAWHQSPFLILPLVVMVCNHNNYAVTHAHIICLVFESF